MLSNLKISARLFLLVAILLAALAAASQEQSSGIEQVNLGVAQMDQVVQHNATLVQEAAAATEAMKARADALLQLVARFRVTSADLAEAPHAVVPPAPVDAHGSYIPRLSAS